MKFAHIYNVICEKRPVPSEMFKGCMMMMIMNFVIANVVVFWFLVMKTITSCSVVGPFCYSLYKIPAYLINFSGSSSYWPFLCTYFYKLGLSTYICMRKELRGNKPTRHVVHKYTAIYKKWKQASKCLVSHILNVIVHHQSIILLLLDIGLLQVEHLGHSPPRCRWPNAIMTI